MPKHTEEKPVTPELTQKEIMSAALNLPAHATEHFKLGDREFTLLDLNYDDFNEFIGYMQPLVDGIVGAFFKKSPQDLPGISLPDSSALSFASLIKYCSKDLPKMVVLVCNTEAKSLEDKSKMVDEKFVRKHLKDPIQAVEIIMLQVNKNEMISRIGSFFRPVSPDVPTSEVFVSEVDDKGNPLLLLESLMERYQGAPLSQLRKLTINQIQMLNHASTVNHERSDEYYEWKKQFKDEDGQPVEGAIKVKVKNAGDVTEVPTSAAMGMMFGR